MLLILRSSHSNFNHVCDPILPGIKFLLWII